MKAIYEPKGKAREYCERAVNLYRGCAHGCSYCYAPGALRMQRSEFTLAKARPGVLDAIRREAPKHAGREVLLCFTTDPYQGDHPVTRDAIKALHEGGCYVNVLTKAGTKCIADLDLYGPKDKLGVTLTFQDPTDSVFWEPYAASPIDRMRALQNAHARGIYTWASFEPVIDPHQSLLLMRACIDFVDYFKIGKWNHDKRANEIDWHGFVHDAIDIMESNHCEYMIKEDLKKYI